MKITIFGLPGTGTTTVGKLLADQLGYAFNSSGNMFRLKALGLGMSINELDNLAQSDSQYDLALDQDVKKYGEEHDNFVIESLMAWHFIPYSVKIKFNCDYEERIKRIMGRENKEKPQVVAETADRLEATTDRYKEYYDISFPPADELFDLVIDTSKITPTKVLEAIEAYLKTLNA